MKKLLQSIGPAIVVAAVVLGPGSILTSSKVGATFGAMGVPVVIGAAILMIGMVALSARIGVVYEGSACDELAGRLGRPVAALIGIILFLVAALFQSSNNIAVVAGLLPLVEIVTGGGMAEVGADGERSIPVLGQVVILVFFNAFVITCLYLLRNLYRSIEKLMKLLIGVMVLAFLFNFIAAQLSAPDFEAVKSSEAKGDLFALLGMIGTTFSVAGAFYQSYLVKEKGWGIGDARRGLVDSVASISVLGLVTIVILLTAARTFYGRPEPIVLAGVDDVARQLEPLFGTWSVVIFSVGIIAGAFSSFLVNSMIGGTVLSDGLGKGSRLSDDGPIHMTTLALLVGMTVAIFSLTQGTPVTLITIAQALTVLGIPALAAALLYLGTRPELTGARKVPRWILGIGVIGFLVACALAVKTALAVWEKVLSARNRRGGTPAAPAVRSGLERPTGVSALLGLSACGIDQGGAALLPLSRKPGRKRGSSGRQECRPSLNSQRAESIKEERHSCRSRGSRGESEARAADRSVGPP